MLAFLFLAFFRDFFNFPVPVCGSPHNNEFTFERIFFNFMKERIILLEEESVLSVSRAIIEEADDQIMEEWLDHIFGTIS